MRPHRPTPARLLLCLAWCACTLVCSAASGEEKSVTAHTFRPKHLSLDAAAARLQTALQEQQIAADVLVESKSQVVVVRGKISELRRAGLAWIAIDKPQAGKPEVLLAAGPANPPKLANAVKPAKPAADENEPLSTQSYELQHLNARDLEATLQRNWKQIKFQPEGNEGVVTARLPGAERAVISIDHHHQLVRVLGAEKIAGEWKKVIAALDAKPDRNSTTALVPLRKADPAQIRQAVRLLAMAEKAVGARRGQEFVVQEEPVPPEGEPGPDEAMEDEMPAEEPEPPPAAGVTGVDIFINEATGQIILKGRKADVERVLKVIQDLEDSIGKPHIEILNLKHISDRAVADLIATIYDQVFSRTGRVSITPLVKPNALLLIGPQEGVEAVKELVVRLDQPVPPPSQLRVFPLRHIDAAAAETTIRSFFVDQAPNTTVRPGLGTRVNVVAEARSNSLIVQASARDLAEVGELLKKIDVLKTPKVAEVRTFRLKNSLAEDLAPVLQQAIGGAGTSGGQTQQNQPNQPQGQNQPSSTGSTSSSMSLRMLQVDGRTRRIIESGILSDVRITADGRANSLIVTAPSASMDLIAALIEQLDQLPGAAASIKVFTLINGDAQTLLNMLQQLFGQANTQGANAQNQLSILVAGSENVLVPLRFAIDARTNSVIASGAAGDLEVVEQILLRLDESDVRRRKTTVYRLRNAPAIDVSNAINQFLQNQRQLLQSVGPNLTSGVEQLEREVVVVPEQVSNSLLVSATPRYYEEIKKIVEDLDRRPPMVVIQCLIAEVTLGNTDEFGVELGLQDSLLFQRGIPAAGGAGGIGFNFNNTNPLGNVNTFGRENVAGQGLTNFAVGRGNSDLGYGGLVLSASNESVSLLVRALQQAGRLQVLSRPQVQMLDNQTGFVQVGSRVPYVTQSNQTTFGIQNTTEFQNVGLLLQVIPRTSPDGLIVMQISAEKSQLGPEATGVPTFISSTGQVIRSPQIFINTAQTVVSAQSGQTVLLGGLITTSRDQETRRTPYLSDIPVLGRLFRFDREVNRRTELLIIMTPTIVRTEEDVERFNARESERMNWCLSDVANLHGELPWAKGVGPWDKPTSPVIFPDESPSGPTPARAPPAGAPENRFEPIEREPTPDGIFERQPR